ncbi:hypothetical protein TorRG33x02_003360 [Trema orientale]|uniref:Uncharacterized protein n=1 Tax=Trema orientale TaxID=63057 RepID=A0A2P5G1X7_TREOI|nr:hypothetical protein TorRG33x02_003360 [Trema orientale]
MFGRSIGKFGDNKRANEENNAGSVLIMGWVCLVDTIIF